jgi:hypothetical protein
MFVRTKKLAFMRSSYACTTTLDILIATRSKSYMLMPGLAHYHIFTPNDVIYDR